MHTHDFVEIFRVDSGRGIHLLGQEETEQTLGPGQVVFIRDRDVHGFRAVPGSEPFAIVNVAFSRPAWNGLRDRYSLRDHPFFSEQDPAPPVQEMSGEADRRVAALFQGLLHAPRTALTRDAFLLSLAHELQGGGADPVPESLPAWLRRGVIAFRNDPDYPLAGVARLAEVCSCSPGHLARTFKASLGQTPSYWLRGERMQRARTLLTSTDFSVAEVAEMSGFENLSHFHRCFRAEHGSTPLQYRKTHSRRVV
jgi:AraC family cel operon transcriptional repressor